MVLAYPVRIAALLVLGIAASLPAECPAQEAPVAEVLGRKILARDIEPPAVSPGQQPLDAAAAERARHERLRALVWSAVFEDYATRGNIAASPAEIESNVRHLRAFRAQDAVRRAAERHRLEGELARPDLPATRRREAEAHLKTLEQIDAFLAQEAERRRDPALARQAEEAQRRVAAHWVRRWKVDQALHREFGGRIIFQQAGWEPIDAYRRLIEDYEARGAFVVPDPRLRAAVYAYFEHKFVYADEGKARFYFEKPLWERSEDELRAAGFK
jgi:hypothetical protein